METNQEGDNSSSKTNPNSSSPSVSVNPNTSTDLSQAYQILYQACPYIKLSHFISSQAILEAFEAKEHVHVIDLDLRYGHQWPPLIQALAARPGGPPFLRLTGIGFPLDSIKDTGRSLAEVAKCANVPFEFHPVEAGLQHLTPEMLHRHGGEALAVNLVNWPRHDGDQSPNWKEMLLTMIRDQSPNIVTITEKEASPGEQSLFAGALRYYSAIFESLGESQGREKVEKNVFAPEIRKVVAMGESEGVVGMVKLMEEKGFRNVPVREGVVAQAKMLLSLYGSGGYTLTEHEGFLQLGWRGTSITVTSAWRC